MRSASIHVDPLWIWDSATRQHLFCNVKGQSSPSFVIYGEVDRSDLFNFGYVLGVSCSLARDVHAAIIGGVVASDMARIYASGTANEAGHLARCVMNLHINTCLVTNWKKTSVLFITSFSKQSTLSCVSATDHSASTIRRCARRLSGVANGAQVKTTSPLTQKVTSVSRESCVLSLSLVAPGR